MKGGRKVHVICQQSFSTRVGRVLSPSPLLGHQEHQIQAAPRAGLRGKLRDRGGSRDPSEPHGHTSREKPLEVPGHGGSLLMQHPPAVLTARKNQVVFRSVFFAWREVYFKVLAMIRKVYAELPVFPSYRKKIK